MSAKVLVLRLPLPFDFEARELRGESVWVDRLCNGLLSRAAAHGIFERKLKADTPWIWLRPVFADFDSLWVWADNDDVEWKSLKRALGEDVELYHPSRHAFSEAELRSARKQFPALSEWKK